MPALLFLIERKRSSTTKSHQAPPEWDVFCRPLIRAYEQRRQTLCPRAIVQLDNGLRKTTLMPKEPIAAHNRRSVSDTPPNKSDDKAQ
jgi:hypothetical protein